MLLSLELIRKFPTDTRSSHELVIDAQPEVISLELTPQLVVNCSITDSHVPGLDTINSLSLSRYNETKKEFDVLLSLDTHTLSLQQLVQFRHAQISFGNLYVTLTLRNPTQSDAKVYRCNVSGDDSLWKNITRVFKKEIKYETNLTVLLEEIRRLREEKDRDQLSCQKEKLNDSKLHFVGNSKVVKELFDPLTLTCSIQDLMNDRNETSTVQSIYILHEANGIIATISKDQPVVTTNQDVNLLAVIGKLHDDSSKNSYLQVTWSNPKFSESGKYFCGAHANNAQGRNEHWNEMLTITVERLQFDDIVKVMYDIQRQVDEDKKRLQTFHENLTNNFIILNTNLQSIENVRRDVRTNQESINGIKDELLSNKQNIVNNKKDINTAKESINVIKEELLSNKQNIVNNKRDIDTMEESINVIRHELLSNKQNIVNNKKDIHTTQESIIGILEELLRNQQNIVNNKKDINTTQDSIREIQEELLRNQQNIENAKEELKSKQDSMKSIQDELLSNLHNMNISSIWKVLSNFSTAVMDMKDDIDKGKTEIKQNKSSITKLHPRSCRDVNSTDDRVVVTLASGLKVMCDTKTDGGGWIIFQRRINGSVDFYRGWQEYRDGFGDYNIGEFYLGNENIYMLTSTGQYDLRIDLKYKNNSFFAQYSSFKILSEKEKYKLNIGVYSGNAGDSFSRHNNSFFTTFDRDNDENSSNCAVVYTGAWWYKRGCHHSNLNGKWGSSDHGKGVNWHVVSNFDSSVSFTEIKIREI
uniref:Fibrinogen-related protein 3.3 n=1 Tax=Biomphalaria glabrata TaxID=6526 RepID=G3LHG0_BIOGL|nr:fibrinogen-related protein 3.3 [Biomphalaria glabrata]